MTTKELFLKEFGLTDESYEEEGEDEKLSFLTSQDGSVKPLAMS